jgi:hypothetical protein
MMGKRLVQHCAILLAAILLNAGRLTCFAQGDEPPSAERPMNAPASDAVSESPQENRSDPSGSTLLPVRTGDEVKREGDDGSSEKSRIWREDPDAALKEGLAQRRPVLIHFHAKWAGPCQAMSYVFFNPDIGHRLSEDFVASWIDVDKLPEVAPRYNINSVPSDIVLNPETGQVVTETNGLKSVVEYRKFLDLAASEYRKQEAKPEVASEQQVDDRPMQAGETQPPGQPGGGGFGGIGFGGGGFGGFGGGGFGSGAPMVGGLGLPESAIPGKRYTAGFSLIVAIADDDSQIFAYSDRHPHWAAHSVPKVGGAELVPVVGQDTAAVMYGHICFAYSPLLGTWDQLTLPIGEGAQPVVGNGAISLHSPTKGDFVFKNDWGKWFSAEEIKAGAVAQHLAQRDDDQDSAEMVLKMFHLKNIEAAATAKLLVQLYGADDVSIVAEEARNSLLVRGTNPRLAEIEAVLVRLDTDAASTANPAYQPTTGSGLGSRDVTIHVSTPSETASELRARYEDLERQVSTLAARLRESPGTGQVDRANQHALRNLVQAAFETRQRLQQAEIAGFAQRLRSLQQTVETRERLRDQVVKRRVEELLNPGLKWEEPASPTRTDATAPETKTDPVGAASEQIEEDAGLFQVSLRDENGLVRVTFQPSPHSTLEQLKAGQRVMVSQTLRPIKAGFDHTPIILENAVLLDFWQDRRRAASNQPVTLQVRGEDLPRLIEAAKLGALEVHAAPPHTVSGSPNPVSSGNTIEPEGTGEPDRAEAGDSVRFLLHRTGGLESCNIRWMSRPGGIVSADNQPVSIHTPPGGRVELQLTNIGGKSNTILSFVLRVPKELASTSLVQTPIPLTLTLEDIDQTVSGNRVTKVLYQPRKLSANGPIYETVVSTRLSPGEDPVKVARERGTIVAAFRLERFVIPDMIEWDLDLSLDSPRAIDPEEPSSSLSSGVSVDPPYEPKSELEKSVAKLVLTFFQDQSRLAVPCLVVNVGDVTYAVSSGTVNLVPKDLPPAIDATHLEWAGSPAPIPAVYDSRSTKEFFLYRVRDNLKAPELTEVWKVSRGDRLSTLYRDSLTTLRKIPVQVTELDVGRDYFTPPGRTIPHQYRGLFHVDRRVPEGTLLFHEGKLAGITILGADYSEGNGAYIVPAFRLLNLLRELHTEGGPDATAPGKQPSSE